MVFINLACYFEGRYLKSYEYDFLLKVEEDVKSFVEKSNHQSFLVFPPLRSRLRYLAHTYLDKSFFPYLCSFSIGPEEERRVVVGLTSNAVRCSLPYECIHKKIFYVSKTPEKISSCSCSDRIKLLLQQDSEFASFMTVCGYLEKVTECNYSVRKMSQTKERNPVTLNADRHRRPDKQLYVPRALRRSKPESISAVKEQDFDLASRKMYQNNEDCRKNFQASVIDETADQRLCLTKRENCVKTELKVKEKSLDEINSHHSDVLPSDRDVEVHKQIDISCRMNVNEQVQVTGDIQYIKTAVHVSDIKEDNDLNGSKIDAEEEDTTPIENSTLSACGNNLDFPCLDRLQEKDSESSIQDEPVICMKDDLNSDGNKVISQGETISGKDCTKEMNVKDHIKESAPPTENMADSWETMFNDDGECLDPKFFEELCDITGRIQVTVAKNDYSEYQPSSESISEEYSNIVELYGFPVEFSTQDLTSAFSVFQEATFSIKWVDDTHALAIFSSPAIASQALHLSHPFIKVRPVSEGIKESKEKARFCARLPEPFKPRPVTSAALARRLVTGALGLKVHTSKEQRDIERKMLREAREKKKLKAKQRQDIWDGIVS